MQSGLPCSFLCFAVVSNAESPAINRCGPVDFRVIQTEENKPRNILEEIVWYAASSAQPALPWVRHSWIINTSLCFQAQSSGNRKDERKAAHSKAFNDAEDGTTKPGLHWGNKGSTNQDGQAWLDS